MEELTLWKKNILNIENLKFLCIWNPKSCERFRGPNKLEIWDLDPVCLILDPDHCVRRAQNLS